MRCSVSEPESFFLRDFSAWFGAFWNEYITGMTFSQLVENTNTQIAVFQKIKNLIGFDLNSANSGNIKWQRARNDDWI